MREEITRQDIHRPAEIKPENYEFVAQLVPASFVHDIGDLEMLRIERQAITNHMKKTHGKYSSHKHGGTCYCCGASASYLSVFYHAATNEYIKLGWICSEKMGMDDQNAFNTIKRAIKNAREAVAGKNKAKLILSDNNLMAAWAVYEETDRSNFKFEEHTVSDIVDKLVRYGSLSDKQISFVKSLMNKIENRESIAAARAEEKAKMLANRKPMSEGQKISLSARVVKTELGRAYCYGAASPMKVTLVDDNYGLLWCQSSSDISYELTVGDKIKGTMFIKKVLDEIAFGRRPSIEIVEYANR